MYAVAGCRDRRLLPVRPQGLQREGGAGVRPAAARHRRDHLAGRSRRKPHSKWKTVGPFGRRKADGRRAARGRRGGRRRRAVDRQPRRFSLSRYCDGEAPGEPVGARPSCPARRTAAPRRTSPPRGWSHAVRRVGDAARGERAACAPRRSALQRAGREHGERERGGHAGGRERAEHARARRRARAARPRGGAASWSPRRERSGGAARCICTLTMARTAARRVQRRTSRSVDRARSAAPRRARGWRCGSRARACARGHRVLALGDDLGHLAVERADRERRHGGDRGPRAARGRAPWRTPCW